MSSLMRAQFSATVGLTDTLLAGPNERRVALIVSSPAANHVTLSLIGPAVDLQGIVLFAGGPPLILLYEHVGQALREEIRAIATVAPQVIAGLDIFEVDCACPIGQQIERRLRG